MRSKFSAVIISLLCSGFIYSVESTAALADEGRTVTQCMAYGFDVRNAEHMEVCKSVSNIINQHTKQADTSLHRFIQGAKANCIKLEGDVAYCDESEYMNQILYNAMVVASCDYEGIVITRKDYDWQMTQHYGTVYVDYEPFFSCKQKQHLGFSEEYLIDLDERLDYYHDYEPTELVEQFIRAISEGNQNHLKPLLPKIKTLSDADIDHLHSQMLYYESMNVAMLKSMVGQGFPIENRLHYYRQPLIVSIQLNRLAITDWLIQQGASLSALDDQGNPLITVAAGAGNLMLVEKLLTEGVPMDGQQGTENPHKFTPLKAAAKGGHVELVRYLHKQGSDVSTNNFLNKKDDTEYHSLLHYAISGGNADIVEDLIRWGAAIDQEDGLIHQAVYTIIKDEGDVRILEIIHRAGVKDRSSDSIALLLPYVISDHLVDTEDIRLFDAVRVLDQLVKNGVDVKNYEKHGHRLNLLMEILGGASYNRYLDSTEEEEKAYGKWLQQFIEFSAHLLIQSGVGVKEQDSYDQTALHKSAGSCYPKVTSMLLQAGANPEVTDETGQKPVDKVLHVQQNLSKPHMVNAVQHARACQQTLQLLQ